MIIKKVNSKKMLYINSLHVSSPSNFDFYRSSWISDTTKVTGQTNNIKTNNDENDK